MMPTIRVFMVFYCPIDLCTGHKDILIILFILDINECSTGTPCNTNVCTNTPGPEVMKLFFHAQLSCVLILTCLYCWHFNIDQLDLWLVLMM